MAASPSPHKPRRRTKKTGPAGAPASPVESSVMQPTRRGEVLTRAPAFALAGFLWPARGLMSQWELLPLILMVAGLFRWAVGLWGYSGFQKPPLFGDYEAQRHWMEITTQLPVSQWYFYDLQWWGLDYPPLTAYHSWLLGRAGALLEPSWFALDTSRGLEDKRLKVFMRATVLVSEYLVYVPAVVIFTRRFSRLTGASAWSSNVALAAILLQPATLLVDHGHFQYNTVMLGLVAASLSSMLARRFLWSAVFFVAALGFKQMALYYALPVFCFLLGQCLAPRLQPGRLLAIAAVTAAAFALLLLPLLAGVLYDWRRGLGLYAEGAMGEEGGAGGELLLLQLLAPFPSLHALVTSSSSSSFPLLPLLQQLAQVVHRVFPFERGLFEDKVANFWCAANVLVKLRQFPPALLQRAALAATLATVLPPSLLLLARPLDRRLPPLALAASAWGFFLFSYQVHEKSVLLPLLPMTLLLAGAHNLGLSHGCRAWVGFANLLGAWTLFPLLKREELAVPYAVITLLWAYLLGLPPTSLAVYSGEGSSTAAAVLQLPFYLAMGIWHVFDLFLVPPPDKPDLWVVLNVGIGAAGFGLCYCWCMWRLAQESGIFKGKSASGQKKTA